MGTIANAKVTHYYNCYNGDFIGCLHLFIKDYASFYYDNFEEKCCIWLKEPRYIKS